ncbi:class I SAM-dependent methyltransferase [Roseicitreum antarcticum]|uniref:Methyltransferase domain-containing protein n=1 Tax=Roseicitreum antarcticum TaxID=564137 RepID=A0A1H2S0J2_9RHOB|nr:class I SAM-dependent methyltransferase [Roseicitreum antarcticum]SDW24604.1 Methyltransferase domain-containing protein [Roseicitreum antarcticum]
MSGGDAPQCPVCGTAAAEGFLVIGRLRYFRCPVCAVRFLHPDGYPDRAAEYAHYLHHENHPDDPDYRQFLSKLAVPLLDRLSSGACGLDYGCGPGPALAAMLREAGHPMAVYDPYFHPDAAALRQIYDFVTCSETAEHFHAPAREFARLMRLVRPGGWLGVMTCFQTDDDLFAGWHYRKDPTHVVFYRAETFRWLARAAGWSCDFPAKDVVLMQRPAG